MNPTILCTDHKKKKKNSFVICASIQTKYEHLITEVQMYFNHYEFAMILQVREIAPLFIRLVTFS